MSDRELNDAYGQIADLKAENKRLQQNIETLERERNDLRGMGSADLETLGDRPDYALAAYVLRDMQTTKQADLVDLCRALTESGNVSRGDWEGLRKFWWAAALRGPTKDKMTPKTPETQYTCTACLKPIIGHDIEERHTLDDEDSHAGCCPRCLREADDALHNAACD